MKRYNKIERRIMEQNIVRPAEGKLGIMVVGCGAVATTFMTGVLMARKGLTNAYWFHDSIRQNTCWTWRR